ncbi:RES family NAD+ phosphorylase [Granulicella mallensis]|uniref:RES domain protein n=1 Tax=Granulicella mallensis (strain ATCC BAA-1857 / DSM 23137 / MP5ACTX8) TaxID=682795 RepID=G8NVZ3_GRAMM|nr:RES family NAD+ phosphorylase [Granulicella mallensis]AEU35413.1 RES domain protein [Granulicella mallensis MP5ACTX8]
MELWRISNYRSLNGEGGRRYAARWHSAGSPIVYLAASPPGALIEVLVHLELNENELPPSYKLLQISVPPKLRIPLLNVPRGERWKSNIALTRSLGDTWLKSRRSALARVPSAILPHTFNYLLNPLHPDSARITIVKSQTANFDPRLVSRPSSK